MPGRHRRSVVATAVLAGTLLAAGCSSTPDTPSAHVGTVVPRGTAPGRPGATPPGTGGAGSAAVRFTAESCPFTSPDVEADCGALEVPAHRGAPDGPTVQVAVARLHATGDNPSSVPLVYLEGGPGGSAVAEADLFTDPASPLLDDRDIILVDPRGAGYAEPQLECNREFDDADDETSDGEILRTCRQRLEDAGIDLTAFTTEESAADVVDLRRVLGYPAWDLFGVSYGTRLAAEVLRQDQDGVRAMVLDSSYPPDIDAIDQQPGNVYRALHALLEDCRADAGCATAFPDLEARLLTTIDRLNETPAAVADADIDGDAFVLELWDALYVTDVIPDIPRAIDAAARGDMQLADDLLMGVDTATGTPPTTAGVAGAGGTEPPPADEKPTDADGLFLAIECAEDIPRASNESAARASASVPEQLRAPLLDDLRAELALCDAWPMPRRQLPAVTSSAPTLILAGEYDPITPPDWGRHVAATLSHARVVEVPGAGHGVIDAGDCATALIQQFLHDPETNLAADALTCAAPVRFRLR